MVKRPIARPAQRRLVAALAALGLIVAVIVFISPPLASTEGGNCRARPAPLAHLQTTDPPRPASAAAFADEAGERRSLADYRGQGVVLNFWATWCAPCVREMPQLDALNRRLAADGIQVLALSEDRGGAPLVEKFYRLNGIRNLDILLDEGGKVLRDSEVRGLPTTVLIDARGREVGRVAGIAEWDSDDVVRFLRRCLKP